MSKPPPGFPANSPNFARDPTPTVEVERLEELHRPLAAAVRDLVEVGMVDDLDPAALEAARLEVEGVVARLRDRQLPGAYGIRVNEDSRSWGWGNAVIGVRNALATPLKTQHDGDGQHWAETELGPRHVGDEPGVAHPGIAGLFLDHLMGETASGFKKVTMTGTLSITQVRPVPIGPVRLEAWVTSDVGRKVVVAAHLFELTPHHQMPAEGPCVTATGLFIVPRWATA